MIQRVLWLTIGMVGAGLLADARPAEAAPSVASAVAAPVAATPSVSPAEQRVQLKLARKFLAQGKHEAARAILTDLVGSGAAGPEVGQAKKLLADLDKRHPAKEQLEAEEGRGTLVMGNAAAWMSFGMFAPW